MKYLYLIFFLSLNSCSIYGVVNGASLDALKGYKDIHIDSLKTNQNIILVKSNNSKNHGKFTSYDETFEQLILKKPKTHKKDSIYLTDIIELKYKDNKYAKTGFKNGLMADICILFVIIFGK